MRGIPEIKNNFTKYKSISYGKKITKINPITFNDNKPSRPDFLYHKSILVHTFNIDNVQLLAEQRKFNDCSYKFQIRCESFCVKPLFRFDSDGSTHQNRSLPLKVQQIPTPHFNYFNEDGKSVAFIPEEIKDVTYSDLRDMQKYFELFCKESYIVLDNNSFPTIIKGDQRELNLDLHNEDFLSDVNFEI
jgi:hypothetical protein